MGDNALTLLGLAPLEIGIVAVAVIILTIRLRRS